MKMKKKTKKILIIILILLLILLGYLIYTKVIKKDNVKESKVIAEIDDFGYELRDNKDERYKKMFKELQDILKEKEVDYDKYASKISEMFIYDFYSLDNKLAKNDIGGVDFIYPDALSNFLTNAESTYYKYVESNIYGNRNQSLPLVDEITVGDINKTEFAVGDTNVDDAMEINVTCQTFVWFFYSSFFDSVEELLSSLLLVVFVLSEGVVSLFLSESLFVTSSFSF